MVAKNYIGRSNHLLISEIYYDPPGPDETEFVEIVNPTGRNIDLSDFSIGDAVNKSDYEDVRRFPKSTIIMAGETILVASAGVPFYAKFGLLPDFEIIDTDITIPDLIDDPNWGDTSTFFQLGNQGDEVLLRDKLDHLIDGAAFGVGAIPGHISCPLAPTSGRSLERYPYWRDTDDCNSDFLNYSSPTPGVVREGAN
jgi:hypothetical protein